jgi:ABC-type phosphate transport system substrate-binding protein
MNSYLFLNLRGLLALLFQVFAIAFVFSFMSCDDAKHMPAEQAETATTGSAVILCDESLSGYLKPAFGYFDSSYADAKITVQVVNAREAMTQLFSTKARGIIIPRTYLRDEDSLMRANKVLPHATTLIATDALVFVVQNDFPLDTISLEQLKKLFTDKTFSLRSAFPQLKAEPVIVSPDANSSEYGNVLLQLTKGIVPTRAITFAKNADEAQKLCMANPNAVCVGYLSRYAVDAGTKMLKIGYADSTGAYIRPKTVHQSNVVMSKYPLPVKIQGLLLEDRRNLPWGFITFLRNDVRAKQYFLKSGIVPENVRFDLIPEEE